MTDCYKIAGSSIDYWMMKMSSKSEKIKPKTDFELVLNYSNQGIWKDDSGAGANAACRIDKTFSAIDPLSEIVWSPDKGFSLKCVDSSFTNKKTSLLGECWTKHYGSCSAPKCYWWKFCHR